MTQINTDAVSGVGALAPVSCSEPLTEHDIYLFREGSHARLYRKMGAHPGLDGGVAGTRFAVWAPNAATVSVVGDFNGWDRSAHRLQARPDESGIWEGFVAGAAPGMLYKYHIVSRVDGYEVQKADPFAFAAEMPPGTASRIAAIEYAWSDDDWMRRRRDANALHAPISIYEFHPGSWRRVPADGNRALSYREMAPQVAEHVRGLGFTHVELTPITEHPFYGSWGYQATAYFAPTARYGGPEDFMYFVDYLHRQGIGVILDWVPSHFPGDQHGLHFFDGTCLFEHADPMRGFHPEWNSYIFNYGRNEVRAFLLSSALFWLDRYHADGLRVDGVASMLYLDYARKEGEWEPNQYGGKEDLDAIRFLRTLNEAIYRDHPDVQSIAEESTDWPMVSRPTYAGGLGFGMKWNMGWMHDTLLYFSKDPVYRRWHQNDLTFGMIYQHSENFIQIFSHDEVVHGKGSMIMKMAAWYMNDKAQTLRALYTLMWLWPGKKALFMGCEFGQANEWSYDRSLDWHLTQFREHGGIQKLVRDLNTLYRSDPTIFQHDLTREGFQWVNASDADSSVISFLRRGAQDTDVYLVVGHYTATARSNYRVGVPLNGFWEEKINSAADVYGGTGQGNQGGLTAQKPEKDWDGQPYFLEMTLPPNSTIVFKYKAPAEVKAIT